MTCYIFIYLNRDMVRGGRSGRVFTSAGRGSASSSTPGTASPTTPVAPPFPSSSPPEVERQHPAADDEGPQLPGRQPCWISGGKIDPDSASRYITTLVHTHIPGPVDAWREFPWRYVFTRPEDLPRARAVWESTAHTNLRKSMYEAQDKAMKTTSSRDPTAWLDYGPVLLRRDYWESLCHRWATGPWQERSQVAKRNQATHPEKNVHTSGSVSYATHSQKLETYDRTMVWVDAAGGPRKGRVYGFGDSLDTTPVLSSYVSSVAPPAYASSSATPPDSGVEEIRTLIREELREELRTHFGVMVEQLISAMQGVRPSEPAPQVSITINFIYFE
ncbi:hypothetical protein Taro_035985 [Colocasia esculenta]|uniref:Uncharacterized protein n=1 Tax=Colocasia esculenta TaxID=4460 RepID=A0A843W768_COLES|nr:hypothetical protein [Colocasia esculenta]